MEPIYSVSLEGNQRSEQNMIDTYLVSSMGMEDVITYRTETNTASITKRTSESCSACQKTMIQTLYPPESTVRKCGGTLCTTERCGSDQKHKRVCTACSSVLA